MVAAAPDASEVTAIINYPPLLAVIYDADEYARRRVEQQIARYDNLFPAAAHRDRGPALTAQEARVTASVMGWQAPAKPDDPLWFLGGQPS